MKRQFWVLIHRYTGLYMAFFLIVAGLTGSILAFRYELMYWLNAEDFYVPIQAKPMLDPFDLRERALLALEPGARCNRVDDPSGIEPGTVYKLYCDLPTHKTKGEAYELKLISLNPYSGERITSSLPRLEENVSFWPLTRKNIMDVIFDLHFTLLLGKVGMKIFGIAALIWTVDCFVGFYLTLPIRHRKPSFASINGNTRQSPFVLGLSKGNREAFVVWMFMLRQAQQKRYRKVTTPKSEIVEKSFWQRWILAWKIKCPSSTLRLNFDLHRAGGLWFWPFLFIFAWSSVMFNLADEAYAPVMKLLFETREGDPYEAAPNLAEPLYTPPIDFRSGYKIAKHLME